MKRVSNQPLREAFVEGGVDVGIVCRELGWIDKRGKLERTRLNRQLGLVVTRSGRGDMTRIATMSRERARTISAAMGVRFEELYPEMAVGCGSCCERCGDPLLEPAELCGFCAEEAMLV